MDDVFPQPSASRGQVQAAQARLIALWLALGLQLGMRSIELPTPTKIEASPNMIEAEHA